VKRAIIIFVLLIASGISTLLFLLVGSLPKLDGVVELAGLDGEVRVERDDVGIPTVRGRNRLDVARATGFVHAQDRFFQMDLFRRDAAGELAALVGVKAVERDKSRGQIS
jgi:penicillin amidase